MPYSVLLRRSKRKKVAPVIGGDPLSDLPALIKEKILVNLPVKEAVRTSLLSRSWKEAWISMPEIVLRDEHCVSIWTDHWRSKNSLEVRQFKKVVDKLLALTLGSIRKFDIASGLDLSKPMNKWMYILVRRRIEQLIIELDGYRVSPIFFSCRSLKHVSLRKCQVDVPKCISGLEKLQTLDLNFCHISMKDIERWVSSCASLQILVLDSFVPYPNLKIRSLSLRVVHFWGCFKNLKLETPNLETARITKFGFSNDLHKGSFVQDFKFLHGLERLDINHAYLLELVEDPPLERLPFHFSNLQEIQIEMNPGDYQEAAFTLALFQSADKLQFLTLKLCSGNNTLASNWWSSKAKGGGDCLKNLETLKLCYLTPSEFEYSFLEFVLLSAPLLKRVILDEVGLMVDIEKLH